MDDEVAAAGQPGCLVQTPPITPAQPPRKHDIGCSGRQELLRDPRISEALRVASRATKEPRAIAGRSGAPCSLSKLRARGLPHFSLPSPWLPSPVVLSQGSRTSEFFPHPSTALHGGAGSPHPLLMSSTFHTALDLGEDLLTPSSRRSAQRGGGQGPGDSNAMAASIPTARGPALGTKQRRFPFLLVESFHLRKTHLPPLHS